MTADGTLCRSLPLFFPANPPSWEYPFSWMNGGLLGFCQFKTARWAFQKPNGCSSSRPNGISPLSFSPPEWLLPRRRTFVFSVCTQQQGRTLAVALFLQSRPTGDSLFFHPFLPGFSEISCFESETSSAPMTTAWRRRSSCPRLSPIGCENSLFLLFPSFFPNHS